MQTVKARLRRDGLWECRETRHGKRCSYYGKTEAEAIAKASAADSKSWTAEPTLAQFALRSYLPSVARMSRKWQDQIVWALDGHILPAFGTRRLGEIDRAGIQMWILGKTTGTRPLSANSAKHIRTIFHAVMRLAEDDGLIERNPVARVKVAESRRAPAPPYSPEEVAALLAAAKGHLCHNAIYMSATLGLRMGECLGLKWSDVKGGRARIERQYSGEPLKTKSSARTIPLPDGWLDGLEKNRTPYVSAERSARNLSGSPSKKGETGRGYRRAVELAGLEPRTFHSLRKSCATMLEEALE